MVTTNYDVLLATEPRLLGVLHSTVGSYVLACIYMYIYIYV